MPDTREKCPSDAHAMEIEAITGGHGGSKEEEQVPQAPVKDSPQVSEVRIVREKILQEHTSRQESHVEKTNTAIFMHGKNYAEKDIITITFHSPAQ